MTTKDEEQESDRIRKMAELRATLEKRVSELQTELEQLRSLLEFVNFLLLEKGFRKPEIPRQTPPAAIVAPEEPPIPSGAPSSDTTAPQPSSEHMQPIPIKTVTGEFLANLYMDGKTMRVVLAPDKQFTVDTPPFTAFLVERVLAKMQEKDRESATAGEILPDEILSYEIIKDGDLIRELSIRNTGEDRSRELKSTIRWTLEKMHEKMKSEPTP